MQVPKFNIKSADECFTIVALKGNLFIIYFSFILFKIK